MIRIHQHNQNLRKYVSIFFFKTKMKRIEKKKDVLLPSYCLKWFDYINNSYGNFIIHEVPFLQFTMPSTSEIWSILDMPKE